MIYTLDPGGRGMQAADAGMGGEFICILSDDPPGRFRLGYPGQEWRTIDVDDFAESGWHAVGDSGWEVTTEWARVKVRYVGR